MKMRLPAFQVGVALGVTLAVRLAAQVSWPEPTALQSQSGQFLVRPGPGGVRSPTVRALATNSQFIELDAPLLVVSCERVRQTLARQLGLTAPWRGRIHIQLVAAAGADDPITLAAERFGNQWRYRMQLPDVVERRQAMRALVQVILLEAANRRAGERSAELPPWLAVGLAEHLLATEGAELLFPPPQSRAGPLSVSRMVVTERRSDPLAAARSCLAERSARTWQELSWPTEQDFSGETAEVYRASAQLLVSELLRLRDGPACYRRLLEELPRHLNWQAAFLEAFRAYFPRLLDVEKWWTLQVVYFSGRNLASTWSLAESWAKLEAAIRVPAQVRLATDQLPQATTNLPMQAVVRDWDFARQTPALQARLRALELVRQRVPPELVGLAEDYRRLLAGYVQQRDKLGLALDRGRMARPELKRLVAETVRQLDALDARLEAARPNQAGNESRPASGAAQ